MYARNEIGIEQYQIAMMTALPATGRLRYHSQVNRTYTKSRMRMPLTRNQVARRPELPIRRPCLMKGS